MISRSILVLNLDIMKSRIIYVLSSPDLIRTKKMNSSGSTSTPAHARMESYSSNVPRPETVAARARASNSSSGKGTVSTKVPFFGRAAQPEIGAYIIMVSRASCGV